MNVTGKGVICAVWPESHMPVDDFGNRAEIIVDGASSLKRTIMGRFYEHYSSYTIEHVGKLCKNMLDQGKQQEAKDYLFSFYQACYPLMYEKALEILPTEQDKINHTIEACKEGLQVWLPQNTPGIGSEQIHRMINEFPVPMSPVTYIGDNGKVTRTKRKILVGSLYMVLLEKIGDDWGATSIPKRQHHGIPGKLTDGDKRLLPWRDQAFKVWGESEVRLGLDVLDPNFVAILLSIPNSPAMCMGMARKILTAPKPTDIKMAIDYKSFVEMPGRAVEYFNHMLEVSGVKLKRGKPINGQ